MNQLLKKDFIKKVQRVGDVIPCNVVINVVLICACNSTGNTIQCLINVSGGALQPCPLRDLNQLHHLRHQELCGDSISASTL